MYFSVVDGTGSCRLLIMLSDGLRCKVLGEKHSQRIDQMLLQEIFQTPFSKKKRKEKLRLNLNFYVFGNSAVMNLLCVWK